MTQETRARRAEPKSSTSGAVAGENAVLLRGRVSTAPERRELPSGSVIVTFRVTVPRSATAMTKGSRQTVDWLDCVAWGAGPQRTVLLVVLWTTRWRWRGASPAVLPRRPGHQHPARGRGAAREARLADVEPT